MKNAPEVIDAEFIEEAVDPKFTRPAMLTNAIPGTSIPAGGVGGAIADLARNVSEIEGHVHGIVNVIKRGVHQKGTRKPMPR